MRFQADVGRRYVAQTQGDVVENRIEHEHGEIAERGQQEPAIGSSAITALASHHNTAKRAPGLVDLGDRRGSLIERLLGGCLAGERLLYRHL